MGSAAPFVSILQLVATCIALAGCGGETVRLGDAAGGTASSGGSAGLGGVSAAGGPDEAGGSGGSGGSGAGGGSAGTAECQRGLVEPNEVVWIGDTWVFLPGTQNTRITELARAAGAIGADEEYVNLGAASTTLSMIADQYETQQATPTKPKVLLMDGGTFDTILANGSDASVANVADTFEQFLANVAADGTVEHIVYFLCPELPMIPGVAALRPLLVESCALSSVPCHFLDLTPLWEGHDEYTGPSGIQASEEGGTVIADSIWAIMQNNCIAQ